MIMPMPRLCSLDGCDRDCAARGLCSAHYRRWLRHGDAGDAATRPSGATRLCARCGQRPRHANSYCKVCNRVLVRQWREENRERDLENDRRWYADNREAILEKRREWKRLNTDKVRTQQERWRERHREGARAQGRRYRELHGDEVNARRRGKQR
jgi:hypothetical protein